MKKTKSKQLESLICRKFATYETYIEKNREKLAVNLAQILANPLKRNANLWKLICVDLNISDEIFSEVMIAKYLELLVKKPSRAQLCMFCAYIQVAMQAQIANMETTISSAKKCNSLAKQIDRDELINSGISISRENINNEKTNPTA
jgi:hypothetical protein